MIPSAREILVGAAFLAQRYGLQVPESAVTASARAEAETLATDEADEPAALFFALCRRTRALGQAWSVLPDLVALSQATTLGQDLRATREELRSLRMAIATRRASYDDVCIRFRAWTS